MSRIDDAAIREIVTGRVVPYIYSFETNTLPNYLKVGDTYRPVEERLKEWRRIYDNLKEVSRHKAVVNDDVFFRDYSVHKYLEQNGAKNILLNPGAKVFSREFFEDASETMVAAAVSDIAASYQMPGKYDYYSYSNMKQVVERHYPRTQELDLRDNQKEAIRKFKAALKEGRTNLLMYAVMRFGKTVTALRCAQEMDSKLTVVVSAKADVADEWKRAVESDKALAGYRFMNSDDLRRHSDIKALYDQPFNKGDGEDEICTHIVVFLTLQDLAGSTKQIKTHHQILQHADVGLLIIDETHFGAHAPILGKILAGTSVTKAERKELKSEKEDLEDLGDTNKLEAIKANVRLHLSGTPYRILMGSEFEPDDIVAFVQFSDIYEAKLQWAKDHLEEESNEWENPYYGFPEMIRFAFNPNESSRKVLEKIPGSKPSELLKTAHADTAGDQIVFEYEQEVLDLLQVLDGSKDDDALLGLLDNDAIKAGKLARHIVMPLPSRAACDALEWLIADREDQFKNLAEYKIINVSGIYRKYKDTSEAKAAIQDAEDRNEKTLTLTVNRMLTGVTVAQWDTMIYLKGTMSPQEYDQAIFRLQSPWIKTYTDGGGKEIKYDMKPQTLLVDLDPARMFVLQENKAHIHNTYDQKIGNEYVREFIDRDLKVSPIIALNAANHRLEVVTATNIMDKVRDYSNRRTIGEEVNEIDVDASFLNVPELSDLISRMPEFDVNKGLRIKPAEGEGSDLDGEGLPPADVDEPGTQTDKHEEKNQKEEISSFAKKLRGLYALILLFAFLSSTKEQTLTDVIEHIDANDNNKRIAKNIGLHKADLLLFGKHASLSLRSQLDYKIENTGYRAIDVSMTPEQHIDVAINKFKRLSESEIFTPSWVVDKMYDAFDKDFWANIRSEKVLDIASKSGSFARGFVARARTLGVNGDEIKDNFYSIPTSGVAYEFTRKMYQALGLNIDNIASHFNSYDLLNNAETRICNLLALDKKFCDITVADLDEDATITEKQSEGSVKFAAVVGNPPYQKSDGGYKSSSMPIYQHFVEQAKQLQPKFIAIITPSRWFGGGKGLGSFRDEMLNDKQIRKLVDFEDANEVFPGIDLAGGVSYFFWAKGTTGLTEVTGISHGKEVRSIRALNEFPVLIRHEAAMPILRKILVHHETHMHEQVSQSKPFGLRTFVRPKPHGELTLIWQGGEGPYPRADITTGREMIDKWKVLTSYVGYDHAGNPGKDGRRRVFSKITVAPPGTICTETYLVVGSYDSEMEAINLKSYMQTRFFRFLVAQMMFSHHITRDAYIFVPVLDMAQEWTDERLCKRYSLSKEEINFIESQIKAME